jgi:hypothetical protein
MQNPYRVVKICMGSFISSANSTSYASSVARTVVPGAICRARAVPLAARSTGVGSVPVARARYLARIIHQPKKPTKEGILGSRMMLKTAVSQEHHNPTNTRIRLCWHCTNRSHSRDQAQCVLAAPSGLQQALRTWVLDALNGAAQDLLGRTHARQQVQTVPQNRRHRARRG